MIREIRCIFTRILQHPIPPTTPTTPTTPTRQMFKRFLSLSDLPPFKMIVLKGMGDKSDNLIICMKIKNY